MFLLGNLLLPSLPALDVGGHVWGARRPHLEPRVVLVHVYCRAFHVQRLELPVGNSKWKVAHTGRVFIIFGPQCFTGHVTWLILNYT